MYRQQHEDNNFPLSHGVRCHTPERLLNNTGQPLTAAAAREPGNLVSDVVPSQPTDPT